MSTIRLLVRGVDGNWSGIVPGDLVARAIAALSADPATFEELQQATGRFTRFPAGLTPLAELLPGDRETPHDLGLVVIDLVGRLVAASADTVKLARKGELFWQEYDEDGQLETTEVSLPFELAADWLLSDQTAGWRELAGQRRESFRESQLDFRSILYGRPLFEYIAVRIWDEYQQAEASGLIEQLLRGQWLVTRELPKLELRDDGFNDEDFYDEDLDERVGCGSSLLDGRAHLGEPFLQGASPELGDPPLERFDLRGSHAEWEIVKQLHVDWLLTPRSDLADRSPRKVALAEHERIMSDLDDQSRRWMLLESEPPGVPPDSAAYRFSSFGTHEWVEYYNLVRELLWDSWFHLLASASESLPQGNAPGSRMGSGSRTEQRMAWRQRESTRLAARAEEWLDQPSIDSLGRTPRSVIEQERRRIPERIPPEQLPIEPDCPLCETLTRSSQPMFWLLDGCHFDDDFAFDQYSETADEWREKQVDWQRFLERVQQQE